jgi:hypothetical protein
MLTYERSDSLEIVGYLDFVNCLDTDKSTSGYVFKLVSGAISWSSSKQTVMTSSMMYVEFVTCYEAVGQAMWLKKFVAFPPEPLAVLSRNPIKAEPFPHDQWPPAHHLLD